MEGQDGSREQYVKKGYLTDDFRIFYLEENEKKEYENHYHDFDKLLYFIKGAVKYTIEGKTYELLPEDIVLVPHGDVHKVEITQETVYERIVIYLSPQYLMRWEKALDYCFQEARDAYANVMRFPHSQEKLHRLADQMKKSLQKKDADSMEPLYQETLVLQFLISLNRAVKEKNVSYADTASCNDKIVEMIRYINDHLTEDISIDLLSQRFFLSKYHMMRQFKQETGYSIGNYISNKRLLYARELLGQGASVTKVCFDCGFQEHSSFTRAYKKLFGITPAKSRKEL